MRHGPRTSAAIGTAAALLICLVPAGGAGAATTAKVGTAAAFDAQLDRIIGAKDGPPGLSVLIDRRGRTEFRRRGVADVATGRAPTRRDHYRIASMAKAFNGAVALSLVQEGELRLDSTIGELLPGLLPQADAVTLQQVLGHTGGLPDYIRQPRLIKLLQRDPGVYRSPRQLVGYVRGVPLRFRPGTSYEYSDTDNVIAGLMAEKATGLSYAQLLARQIYRPLGLKGTSLPRTLAMPRPYMHGYDVTPGEPPQDVSHFINPALAWASGGIVSTPVDVGRFFRAYVGGRLFDDAGLRRAQRHFVRHANSSPPGPGRNSAGLALFRYQTRCGTVYGHTGSFPGYRLFGASSADGRSSVVFTVNAQIVPPSEGPEPRVSKLIRRAQELAVCRALGR
jgi:D-alanyl-D-alanine carboxypeptidase